MSETGVAPGTQENVWQFTIAMIVFPAVTLEPNAPFEQAPLPPLPVPQNKPCTYVPVACAGDAYGPHKRSARNGRSFFI